jgi:hypothetical protein
MLLIILMLCTSGQLPHWVEQVVSLAYVPLLVSGLICNSISVVLFMRTSREVLSFSAKVLWLVWAGFPNLPGLLFLGIAMSGIKC